MRGAPSERGANIRSINPKRCSTVPFPVIGPTFGFRRPALRFLWTTAGPVSRLRSSVSGTTTLTGLTLSRLTFAATITFGLTLAMFITLYLVPAVYTAMYRRKTSF